MVSNIKERNEWKKGKKIVYQMSVASKVTLLGKFSSSYVLYYTFYALSLFFV